MGMCPRHTGAEGSSAPPQSLPMIPPSRTGAPPPHSNGEELRERTLYGRRRGKKLRAGQEALLDTLLPRISIEVPDDRAAGSQKLDLSALFGGEREIWFEVGFGAGEHLVWQAEHRPDVGLIGCEPYINGVAKCLAHIERAGVSNVRLFADDLASNRIDDVFDVRDVWPENFSTNSVQKVWAAKFAARHPNVAVLDLSSFKCGQDTPTYGLIFRVLGQASDGSAAVIGLGIK